jgi:hypothetical protein
MVKGLDEIESRLHQLQVEKLGRDFYALLPTTIRVQYKGFSVPIPIKTLLSEDQFVDMITQAFHAVGNSLEHLELWLKDVFAEYDQKGITEASLMAMATPLVDEVRPETISVALKRIKDRRVSLRDESRFAERRRKYRALREQYRVPLVKGK